MMNQRSHLTAPWQRAVQKLFRCLLIFGISLFAICAKSSELLCRSALFSYELLKTNTDSVELAIPTRDGAYQYISVQTWSELETHLEAIPKDLREHHRELLQFAKNHFQSVVIKYRSLAKRAQGTLHTRLKESESLKEKILDRAKSYNLKGKEFKDSDLHDLIGMRLVLPFRSPKLRLGRDIKSWAKVLEIDPKQIIEVEIKDKNYRATHLAILDSAGVEFELQVMSKLIAHWHRWDHKNVYKPIHNDSSKKDNLKKYSATWAQIFNTLEDTATGAKRKNDLENLWKQVGWRVDKNSNWMFNLDQTLRKQNELPPENSILIDTDSATTHPTWNRSLIKELNSIMAELYPN